MLILKTRFIIVCCWCWSFLILKFFTVFLEVNFPKLRSRHFIECFISHFNVGSWSSKILNWFILSNIVIRRPRYHILCFFRSEISKSISSRKTLSRIIFLKALIYISQGKVRLLFTEFWSDIESISLTRFPYWKLLSNKRSFI